MFNFDALKERGKHDVISCAKVFIACGTGCGKMPAQDENRLAPAESFSEGCIIDACT